MSYRQQREWADRFTLEIQRTLAPYVIVPATFEQDAEQATDLTVFKAGGITIAARIRKPEFFDRYPTDFTIRYSLKNGAKTEYQKMVEGWGDWMFYGHAKEESGSTELRAWYLLDLSHWRAHLIQDKEGCRNAYRKHANDDGSTLLAFDLSKMTGFPKIVIHASPAAADAMQKKLFGRNLFNQPQLIHTA